MVFVLLKRAQFESLAQKPKKSIKTTNKRQFLELIRLKIRCFKCLIFLITLIIYLLSSKIKLIFCISRKLCFNCQVDKPNFNSNLRQNSNLVEMVGFHKPN